MDIWIEFTNSRYGYMASLVPNTMLLAYTTFKVMQLCGKRNRRDNDKLYGQHRFVVFILMLINVLTKCLYDVKGLYIYYSRHSENIISMYIFSVLGQFRTMLVITVATYFAKSWHKSYTLFEETEESKRKHRVYCGIMFFINVSTYGAVILTPLYWVLNEFYLLTAMFGMFTMNLFIVTLALGITGKNFYTRVLNLLNYTGRSVKSSRRFLRIYYLILICCTLKCMEMGMTFTLSWGNGWFEQEVYYVYDIISLFIFRAFIEPLFYLCLIFLLNESVSKCKSMANDETASEHFIQNIDRSQSQSLEVY